MKVTMTLRGGPEMNRILNALSASMREEILLKMLRVAAEPMRAEMAANAPRSASTDRPASRPIGHLADHIVVAPTSRLGGDEVTDEHQAAVAIGPSGEYFWGIFLEFGTVHMSAHAFARPAFDSEQDAAFEELKGEFWDVMENVVGSTTPSASGTGLL